MEEATYWQRMEMLWSMLSFLTIVFAILLYCCDRKFIYATLMTMEGILYLYKTDAEIFAPLQTNTYSPFHSFPRLPNDGPTKPLLTISPLIVVIFIALGIFFYIKKRYRLKSSLMGVCFLYYPVSKWLCENAHCAIFVEIIKFITQKLFGHTGLDIPKKTTLHKISEHCWHAHIYCRCYIYLEFDWSGVILTDDMEHFIPLPSKGQISLWIDNDLMFIKPQDPH